MPCVALPAAPLPTLPSPLSVSPPTPPPTPAVPGANLCCKIPPVPSYTIPVPIPSLILNPGVIATLNAYITAIQAYLAALPLKCPLE